MLRFFSLSIIILIALKSNAQNCVQTLNFNNWIQTKSNCQTIVEPVWQIQSGGTVAVMKTDTKNPSFLLSPFNLINVEITGTIRVNTNEDDDWFGFVFGHQSPFGSSHSNSFDTYIFDWKKANQGCRSVGQSVARLNGTINCNQLDPTFFCHTNSTAYNLLANNFGSAAWQSFTDYNIRLEYTTTRVRIFINNVLRFDLPGCYKPGRFGFYNLSQEETFYSNFNYRLLPDFNILDNNVCVGNPVRFQYYDTSCGAVTFNNLNSLTWNFGDGSSPLVISNPTSANVNPTYNYTTGGSYNVTLTVTDANNCTGTVTKSVTIGNAPNAGIAGNGSICLGQSTTLTASGGNTYIWNNSLGAGAIKTVSPTTTTQYSVTVTNSAGCTTTALRTVNVSNPAVAGILSGNQNICVGGNTVFSVSGNSAIGTFSSSNNTVATVNPTNGTVNAVSPGTANITYTVLGTNGCPDSSSTRTINVSNKPSAGTLSGDQNICVGSTTIFNISGNSATGTFSSSNNTVATVNPTTGLINAISGGTANITYTVLGTNGCDDVSDSRIVNVFNKPVAGTISGNQNICVGGSTVFSVSGNSATGTFSSSNNSVATVNSITGVINAVSPGTANITYTVLGNNGCGDSSTSRIINIFDTPVAGNLTGNQNICVGGNTVFSVSGNSATGTFSSANNNIAIVNATTGEVSGIAQGTTVITYTVQGVGGCPNNIASRTITVSEPINISAISGLDNICIGSTNNIYTATPNGGIWSVNNTNIATINPSSGVVTALASDTTSIIYTVAGVGGCPSQTISKLINIVEPPVVSNLSKIKNVTCNGGNDGSIEIVITSGNPPYTTLWNPGNETGLEIFDLQADTYTLQITDTFGCSNQFQFNVTEPLPITLSATITEPLCFGNSNGSINLNVVNINLPASYVWSPGGSTTQNITNISAGTYNVTVTDNNDCQQTLSVNLTQPNELLLNSIVTNVSCYNGNDANIEVITSGGTPNYTYNWSINNANGNNLSNLPSGSYAVTVVDANGCQKTETAIIESPQAITVIASNDTVIAFGYSVSLEVVNTTGGTPSYNYTWQPESTLNTSFGALVTAKPTENTTYIITAVDENGCVGYDTVLVRVDIRLYDFPDAFTPNNDGLNDYFNIIKSPVVELIEFQVFNRWGQLIFSGNNSLGWDGRFNSVLQPMDTYVYQAIVQLPDGKREKPFGSFILVR